MEEIRTAVKTMTAHGMEPKNIKTQITKQYKDAYLNGSNSEKVKIKDAIEKAYKELGYSTEDADKVINKWKKDNGSRTNADRLIGSGAMSDSGNGKKKTYEGSYGMQAEIVDGKLQTNVDSNLNGKPAEEVNGRLYLRPTENAMDEMVTGSYVSEEMKQMEKDLYSKVDGKFTGYGNIDLNHRKVVHNPDGSISTELSFTVGFDDKVYLLPTVIDGKIVSEDEAIEHFLDTGEFLGEFDDEGEAQNYAQILHNRQDWYYHR